MRILLTLAVTIVLLLLGAYAIAHSILEHQVHVRKITLQQTPEAIFALLTDLPKMTTWNRNLQKVEMLPPIDGKEASRQTFKGNMQMTVVTTESAPPHRLVRTVRDTGEHFTGSWTYEIAAAGSASEIVLTEEAETSSAFFRLMARIFGQTKYIDEHLADIAKHFGETAAIH